MRFSPSGDMLMTGSADGTSSIWDTKFLEKRGNRRLSSEELDIIQVNSMSRLSIKDIELG
jgi:WD40 repeat protein